MKRQLSLVLALVICLSLTIPASAASGFSDVPSGAYYANAVSWAVEQGITSGTGKNTFTPDRVCTHGEIITFLWRAAGKPASSGEAPLTSEPYGDFRSAANWAYEKGIIDGSFQTGAACTRSSTVTYMWKAAGSPNIGTSGFSDVPGSAVYAKAVNWAVANGVTSGTNDGSTFSPDITCDRGQIVTFLYREKVAPLRVYTTDPSIYLTMTECNYLRVRESDTAYAFSSTRVTFAKAWSNAHGTTNTVTWTVDDPSVLSQLTPAEVVEDWMNSPDHRANILHAD